MSREVHACPRSGLRLSQRGMTRPRRPIRDDARTARLRTRREILALLGASGAALLAGRAAASTARVPACVVRPRQTEGPFYVDEKLDRSDIRADPATGVAAAGAPLHLAFTVSRVAGGECRPLAGARVDVWHCDARGVYSDVTGSEGQGFLRGAQRTDDSGVARFTTIYPGWYGGRTVHVHFKIRPSQQSHREFVSQLYFDDALTDRVHALAPYATRGRHPVRNADDAIYRRGGDLLMLDVVESAGGYAATFDIGLRDA
jgi:protocatechuate 3,4-dioxygenase beta subunit